MDAADPRGTVTFLFTDIEGSTDLWDRDPAAMDRALQVHDDLVESAIAERAGVVFSRAGDSFAAAFASASQAVAAAVVIQRALVSQPEPFALRLRIGLHTGESYERDHNYFGPTVNRASRLMAAAHGGKWSARRQRRSWPARNSATTSGCADWARTA